MNLSRADSRLLDALQRDVTPSQTELADLAGMSRTSCWRRIREFEESGVIERQVALLNPRKLGFQIHVMLAVAMVTLVTALYVYLRLRPSMRAGSV